MESLRRCNQILSAPCVHIQRFEAAFFFNREPYRLAREHILEDALILDHQATVHENEGNAGRRRQPLLVSGICQSRFFGSKIVMSATMPF